MKDLANDVPSSIKMTKKGLNIPFEAFLFLDGILTSILEIMKLSSSLISDELAELLVLFCSKLWEFFVEIFEKYNTIVPELLLIPFWKLKEFEAVLGLEITAESQASQSRDTEIETQQNLNLIPERNQESFLDFEIQLLGDSDRPIILSPSSPVLQEDAQVTIQEEIPLYLSCTDLKQLSIMSHDASMDMLMNAINWMEKVNSHHITKYIRTRRKLPKKHQFSLESLSNIRKYHQEIQSMDDAKLSETYTFGTLRELRPFFLRMWVPLNVAQ
jgi:hypothetical protein